MREFCFSRARYRVAALFIIYATSNGAIATALSAGTVIEALESSGPVCDRSRRPFVSIKDANTASIQDVQQLYEQANSISSISDLLTAASGPLYDANAEGKFFEALLSPMLLQAFTARPDRCDPQLAQQLYDLSQSLCESMGLQGCHYNLSKALKVAFAWLRDKAAADKAAATATGTRLPATLDISSAAMAEALLTETSLADAAAGVAASCRMSTATFAELVAKMSSVLVQLHDHLPALQLTRNHLIAASRKPAAAATAAARSAGRSTKGMARRSLAAGDPGVSTGGADDSMLMGVRRTGTNESWVALDSFFGLPPPDFAIQPPSATPRVLIPVIFHILLYKEGPRVGPPDFRQSALYVQRLIRIANAIAKPTNIQFRIKEVRTNATRYPYLSLKDRATWNAWPNKPSVAYDCVEPSCRVDHLFVYRRVADYPRSINVFVASDSVENNWVPDGRTTVPGVDWNADYGYIFLSWNVVSGLLLNSRTAYNIGPLRLTQALFNFLGLGNTFSGGASSCEGLQDADGVDDTPAVLGPPATQDYFPKAATYCMEQFWGRYSGDWDSTYSRWGSAQLGIPTADKNAWADSCPGLPGYDEIGNFMTHTHGACYAALGHFTRGQVGRAHAAAAAYNPVLYAWGQYDAATTTAPPPQRSPPEPLSYDVCKVTAFQKCPCKSRWSPPDSNGTVYSYCDMPDSFNNLRCEVQDPSACEECSAAASGTQQCILTCEGTARMCKRPNAPGTSNPPPPPRMPRSPPPAPPPSPPLAVPDACQITASGCRCRSQWVQTPSLAYGSLKLRSYCSPLTNDATGRLWCVVEPSCPTFARTPLQPCDWRLTAKTCRGTP